MSNLILFVSLIGMRRYDPWKFSIGAFGECLPYEDNRVSLHPTRVDRFGIPQLRFDVTFRDNELRMRIGLHLASPAACDIVEVTHLRRALQSLARI